MKQQLSGLPGENHCRVTTVAHPTVFVVLLQVGEFIVHEELICFSSSGAAIMVVSARVRVVLLLLCTRLMTN